MKTDWSEWEPVRKAMTPEEQEEFDEWKIRWMRWENMSFKEWFEKQYPPTSSENWTKKYFSPEPIFVHGETRGTWEEIPMEAPDVMGDVFHDYPYGTPPIQVNRNESLEAQVCPNCSIAYVGTHCPRCTARIE